MAIWQRHPRYFIFVAVVLVVTFLTLGPYDLPGGGYVSYGTVGDHSLPQRMARAEKIYQKVLVDRQGLINQFGPTPEDIDMCVLTMPYCQLAVN